MASPPERHGSRQPTNEIVWLTELQKGYRSRVLFNNLLSLRKVKLGGTRIISLKSYVTKTTYGIALITTSLNTDTGWMQGMLVMVNGEALSPERAVHLQLALRRRADGRTTVTIIP